MVDEWSGFAALLANLIEKYAVVLNLDALPDCLLLKERTTSAIQMKIFTETILNPRKRRDIIIM